VKGNLSDWYEIYLWNYCSGAASSDVPTYCSPRVANFYFDPLTIWGLNSSALTQYIPSELNKGLQIYDKVSRWLFVAYTIAFWTTVGSFVLGFFAICSRWGSFVTTIVIGVATLFTILAAVTSTILFSTLTGSFNTALRGYGIHLSVGTKMLALEWIAVAFSLGAAMFWFISICCCSGKSSHPLSRDAYNSRVRRGEKAASAAPFGNRGYQPLGEGQQQWGGGAHAAGHEMDNFGGSSPYKGRETAYEPFRHERV
jgi:SUR7/PalI family